MDPVELHGWTAFFEEVFRLTNDAERKFGIANHSYSEYVIERLELCVTTCSSMLDCISGSTEQAQLQGCTASLSELLKCLHTMLKKWEEYKNSMEGGYQLQRPSTVSSGDRGRPSFYVSKAQIEYLSSLSFKWTEIAAIIGISRMTLYRRRVEYGLVQDPATVITDDDLRDAIKDLRQHQPFCGISMVWGNLRARGIKVTRERVRHTLQLIDPLGRMMRCLPGSIRRQPYSVPGPNSLWHIDSHHKLIRWGMVTHGCIDGYSRLIIYLQCTSNNRASTVHEIFLRAVGNYSLPSRVRSDQGLENMSVATYMIEKRGSERRSMLTGSSTHNQRIERLWKDMHSCVTVLYYKLFYFMEEQELLDRLQELHLWALHFVYLQRINRSVNEFVHTWNNHSMRTANHKTPQQLYTAGCLLLHHANIGALDFDTATDDYYGVDTGGPHLDTDDQNAVVVPENTIKFSDEDVRALNTAVNPLGPSDNYGIDIYEHTLQYISTLTPQ